ncbi:MAG: hypothetical protein J5526_07495 [Bacteroidales bacterium]|nr:hypothetical protein [Bacteroidales bacterium]
MNNNYDILEDMQAVWQQHSEHIDRISRQHDLSHINLPSQASLRSTRRRKVFVHVSIAAVCLAAIVAIVPLRRYYVSDIFDFLLILLLALTLLFAAVQGIVHAVRLFRPSQSFLRTFSPMSLRFLLPRAAVVATFTVMLLFLVLPVPNGRAMSDATPSQRAATLNNVSLLLTQTQ